MDTKALVTELHLAFESDYERFEDEFEMLLLEFLHLGQDLYTIEQEIRLRGYSHIGAYQDRLVTTFMDAVVRLGGAPVDYQQASELVLRDWGHGSFVVNLRSIVYEFNKGFQRIAILSSSRASQEAIKKDLDELIKYFFFRLRRTMRTELVRVVADATLKVLTDKSPNEIWYENSLESDLCDHCRELAANSPYTLEKLPFIPQHPHCNCFYAVRE